MMKHYEREDEVTIGDMARYYRKPIHTIERIVRRFKVRPERLKGRTRLYKFRSLVDAFDMHLRYQLHEGKNTW